MIQRYNLPNFKDLKSFNRFLQIAGERQHDHRKGHIEYTLHGGYVGVKLTDSSQEYIQKDYPVTIIAESDKLEEIIKTTNREGINLEVVEENDK